MFEFNGRRGSIKEFAAMYGLSQSCVQSRLRYGIPLDQTDADWFWLIGHLAGKAIHKPEKLLHHIVTTAAACLNWHMQRTVGNDMRPGIETKEPT